MSSTIKLIVAPTIASGTAFTVQFASSWRQMRAEMHRAEAPNA